MANDLIVGQLVELKVYCTSQGQWSINTLHYAVTETAGLGATDGSLAVEASSIVAPLWKALMSNKAQFEGVTVQIILPTRLPKIVFLGDNGEGGDDADVLPRQVAGLVRKLTNVASKHGRGRLFMPFPSEDMNDQNGFPTAGYVTALNGVAAFVDDPIEAGGGGNTATLDPVVYDREAGNGILITGGSSSITWSNVRRRMDSRGRDRPPF